MEHKTSYFIKLILILISLTILGCGGGSTSVRPIGPGKQLSKSEMEIQVAELEKQGDFIGATKVFIDLSIKTSDPSKKMDYELAAVGSLLKGGYLAQANRYLDQLGPKKKNRDQSIHYRLHRARSFSIQGKSQRALAAARIAIKPDWPLELRIQSHLVKAQVFKKTGNPLEAVQEYVQLISLVQEPQLKLDYQTALWEILMGMSANALSKLILRPPPDIMSGWMELAHLTKTKKSEKEVFELEVARWQKRYPSHPAQSQWIQQLLSTPGLGIPGKTVEIGQVQKIALLLSISEGKLKHAAEAIQEGFFGAYFGDRSGSERPEIQVYDVSQPGISVRDAYRQAVKDGASIVVGPLDKKMVNDLVRKESLDVPTLTLNFSEVSDNLPKNLFQFSLAPEDEARQVAEHAWLAGHRNAVAIVPKGPWGDRILNAFTESWQKVDGHVVAEQAYSARQNDFSQPLKRLLNIYDSQSRFVEIRKTISKGKVEFTPRRRKDVDFVFMVAFPQQARQLQPQLKFHYAADLPIYAISRVFTGTVRSNTDRDLDGINFCDMPWTLKPDQRSRALQNIFSRSNPKVFQTYKRLYALGIDAYNLISELSRLNSDPYGRFEGQTGSLHMDAQRRIRRQLTWARFNKGTPRVILTETRTNLGSR